MKSLPFLPDAVLLQVPAGLQAQLDPQGLSDPRESWGSQGTLAQWDLQVGTFTAPHTALAQVLFHISLQVHYLVYIFCKDSVPR